MVCDSLHSAILHYSCLESASMITQVWNAQSSACVNHKFSGVAPSAALLSGLRNAEGTVLGPL